MVNGGIQMPLDKLNAIISALSLRLNMLKIAKESLQASHFGSFAALGSLKLMADPSL